MKYIVLDTEWNNSFCKQYGKHINELIEIGAVKLDDDLNVISQFKSVICSQLTNNLSDRFMSLTNITNEEMSEGLPFDIVLQQYSDWSGENAITMTWSDSDLYVLFENCRLFTECKTVPCISKYVDLQKFVQNELILNGEEIKSQISLSNAAAMLGLSTEGIELHRAIDDSRLSAEILQKTYDQNRLHSLVVDTSKPDFYERLTYKPYIISDIENPLINKNDMHFLCDNCNKFAQRTTPWTFKFNSFRAAFRCRTCGDSFVGRITYKKMYDHVSVKRFKTQKFNQEQSSVQS